MQEIGEILVWSLGREDPLKEGKVTQSSIPAWRIPWTQEPGRLVHREAQSQTWLKQLSMHTCIYVCTYVLVCICIACMCIKKPWKTTLDKSYTSAFWSRRKKGRRFDLGGHKTMMEGRLFTMYKVKSLISEH